jgi:putative ABC transport system substrate-binding protein
MGSNRPHRREFLALTAAALVAWPRLADGQQTIRRVAWLGHGQAGEQSPYLDSLRAGLHELGWVEGRNLALGIYWATGRDNMEAVARELLASDPEVIVAQEYTVLAFQSIKTTKPVVFGFSGDPLDVKLVESWAKPGGNFTGMSHLAIELVGKRVELLKEWLPHTRRIAILARPQHPGEHLERRASEAAAEKLGLELSYFPLYFAIVSPARDLSELDAVFRAITADRSDNMAVIHPATTSSMLASNSISCDGSALRPGCPTVCLSTGSSEVGYSGISCACFSESWLQGTKKAQ